MKFENGFKAYGSKTGAIIASVLEVSISITSLVLAFPIARLALESNFVLMSAVYIFVALWAAKLSFLILTALAIRFAPKPQLGPTTQNSDPLKKFVLSSLNRLIRRSCVREDYSLMPFPGALFYRLSGAKIGKGCVFSSPDIIIDAHLVSIGDNCLLGYQSVILGHYRRGVNVEYCDKVEIGNNVLIGRGVTIWPGVIIGDNAVIQEAAVVNPGTIVGANEIWGGHPAQKLYTLSSEDQQQEYKFKPSLKNNSEIDQLVDRQVSDAIINFVKDRQGIILSEFDPNVSLVEAGILDSLSVLNLVNQLEDTFEVKLDASLILFEKNSLSDLSKAISGQIVTGWSESHVLTNQSEVV